MNRRNSLKAAVAGILAGLGLRGTERSAGAAVVQPPSRVRRELRDPLARDRGSTTSPPEPLDPQEPSSPGIVREPIAPPPAGDVPIRPGAMPVVPGFEYAEYDIRRYTRLLGPDQNPEQAVRDWIQRGLNLDLYGPQPGVISVSRDRLWIYHNPKVILLVEQLLDRFVQARNNWLKIRVRIITTDDLRWRETYHTEMQRVAYGPQGQTFWIMDGPKLDEIWYHLRYQRQITEHHSDQERVLNGQTLRVTLTGPATGYRAGLKRGERPGVYTSDIQQLREQIVLSVAPLYGFDGETIDVEIGLGTNSIQALEPVQIVVPSQQAASASIQVPRVATTQVRRILTDVPIGDGILISSGVTSSLLETNSFRLLALGPPKIEALAFLTFEAGSAARSMPVEPAQARRSSAGIPR